MKKKELDLDLLEKLLRLDARRGKLYWRRRNISMFPNARVAKWWNGRYAGKEALINVTDIGYMGGTILGISFKAHRIIWAMHHRQWPYLIDHVDGNRQNNKIKNLRTVSDLENGQNCKRSKRNKSGVTGVCWIKKTNRWIVQIHVNGKNKRIGDFKDKQAAITARENANIEYGYHPNHGRAE